MNLNALDTMNQTFQQQTSVINIYISLEITVLVNSLLIAISVIGVFGNVLISYSICKNRCLRTPMNANLVSMAFADIFVCLILIPVRINIYNFPARLGSVSALCTLDVLLKTTFDSAQLFMLVSTSYERYQSVAKPFDKDGKARRTFTTLATAWTSAVAVGLLCCLNFGDGATYYPCYSHYSVFPNEWGMKEKFVTFPIGMICIVSVIVLYVLIMKLLKEHRAAMQNKFKKKKPFKNVVAPTSKGKQPANETNDTIQKQQRHEQKTDVEAKTNVIKIDVKDDKGDSGYIDIVDNYKVKVTTNTNTISPVSHIRPEKRVARDNGTAPLAGVEDTGQLAKYPSEEIKDTNITDHATRNAVSKEYHDDSSGTDKPIVKISIGETKIFIIRPDRKHSNPTKTKLNSDSNGLTVNVSSGKFYEATHTLMQQIRKYSEKNSRQTSVTDSKLCGSVKLPVTTSPPGAVNGSANLLTRSSNTVNSRHVSVASTSNIGETNSGDIAIQNRNEVNNSTEPESNGSNGTKETVFQNRKEIETNTTQGTVNALEHCTVDTTNNEVDIQAAVNSKLDNVTLALKNPGTPKGERSDVVADVLSNRVDVVEMNGTIHTNVKAEGAVVGAVCMMNRPNKEQGRRKVESRAAKRISLLIGTFIILWLSLPITVIFVSSKYQIHSRDIEIVMIMSVISTLTVALNPILNLVLNKQMRSVTLNTVRTLVRRVRGY